MTSYGQGCSCAEIIQMHFCTLFRNMRRMFYSAFETTCYRFFFRDVERDVLNFPTRVLFLALIQWVIEIHSDHELMLSNRNTRGKNILKVRKNNLNQNWGFLKYMPKVHSCFSNLRWISFQEPQIKFAANWI